MGGSTDETVQVFLANVEVYVQTMDGGPVDVVSDDVVDHLVLEFGEGVCGAMGGDAGRVPRNVTVFITAEENDFSEVSKMASVAEVIEESFSGISSFFHGKLREALNIFELSDRP